MSDSIAVAGGFINSLKICLTDYYRLSYSVVIETGEKIMNIEEIRIDGIPSKVLKLFILSLFENGSIQIGNHRIVSWNNNDRHIKNKIWETNKSDFEKYGLLKTIKTKNGEIFHEINNNLGAEVWRTIVKLIIKVDEKPAVKKEVVNKTIKLSRFEIDALLIKRDLLETKRKQAMRSVSLAQINNKGHYTSVKVKEGYAERLSLMIDKIDAEIEK